MPTLFLIISLVALLVGPLLFSWTGLNRRAWQGIDAFVLVAIGGIVFFHVLPDSWQSLGWPAPFVALLSFFLPAFFEKVTKPLAATTHYVTLVLALVGLSAHAFTDGIALLSPELTPEHQTALPLAIILHRIPDGITIWWLLRPSYGIKMATRTLVIMALATVAGFFFGQNLFHNISGTWFGILEALLAGALLHVIFHVTPQGIHQHSTHPDDKANGLSAGIGALLAIMGLVLFFAFGGHEQNVLTGNMFRTFGTLALQSAPALVLAYVASGILEFYVNKTPVAWLSRGGTATQALKGMILGLPLPLCSCGVIPVYRTLVKQGTPLAAALAFLVATPELSTDALILSLPLLGGKMTVIRLVFAAIVAFLAGYLVSRFFPQKSIPPHSSQTPTPARRPGLFDIIKHGFGDVFNDTMPWILVGLTIAAVVSPWVESGALFDSIPDFAEVPLFALLGLPVYVCASGATPLVAVLLAGGASPGAALAFLLTGPATNVTTFGVLSKLHGKKIAATFMVSVFVLTVIMGMGVNLIMPSVDIPSLQPHEHGTWQIIQQLSLLLLGITMFVSILRNGPRKFLHNIMPFEEHGHEPAPLKKASCCEH